MPNTANAAYLFLVIKKKVDAANSEHQQWPQNTLSLACYCRPTLLAGVFPVL